MTLVDLSKISIGLEGEFGPCPGWYSGFINFAASISMDAELGQQRQSVSVLTVPRITGVTSALALGALYGEVYKIRSVASLEKISVDQLVVGMHVSVICGTGSHQAVGEVTQIQLSDRNPRVTIGNVMVAVRSIREINLLPRNIGKPKKFKKLERSSNTNSDSFFAVLADSSLPIFRSLVMLRSTSQISMSELSLQFRDESTGQIKSISDLLNPIQANSVDEGTTLVLNSSEEDQIEWLMSQLHLSTEEATPQVAIMGSASSILSQIDTVNNKKVIAVLGRDERQIEASADAVRISFAYSLAAETKEYWKVLPDNTELVSFERSTL